MVTWGHSKKKGQSYIKDKPKGMSGAKLDTNPTSDVHMKEHDSDKKKHIDRETEYFLRGLSDYGSADIDTAVETFDEVGLLGSDLADRIREFSEETDTPLKDIDPVYVAYDTILQMARNKIDDILNFDIVNDIDGDTEFYTAGNYMATSYDYSTKAHEQLEEKIKKATKEQKEELKQDKYVKHFLEYVDIDLK